MRTPDLHAVRQLVRVVVLDMGRSNGGAVAVPASPAPPWQEDRPEAFGKATRARGMHRFLQWGGTGSAGNPWKSGVGGAKSLIFEEMPSTSCPRFSTGCPGFSTGRISVARRPPFPSSLSKSLKRKRKKQGERQAGRARRHPRVGSIFPRVFAPAYFFIHGFRRVERANPWKSVDRKAFGISELGAFECASTGPQVALPVFPLHAKKWGWS